MSGNRSSRARPKEMDFPRLVERYGSEDKCRLYLEELRWPDGVVCPKCGHRGATWLQTRRVRECNARSCGYQFSVRNGTVLADSKLPLWKWFVASLLMCESKKGMSANQIRRMTGVTYKTAWFLTHRIRQAMGEAVGGPMLTGAVEVDETYIGGKPRFSKKASADGTTAATPRPPCSVRAWREHPPLGRAARDEHGTLHQFIGKHVDPGTPHLYTDSAPAYGKMTDADTTHEIVNHRAYEWVRGDVHTNTIESAWSLFKRSIVGSYHHLSVKHMDSYLDEFEFRYNNRHNDFLFRDTLKALLKSETMTYKALTERPA